MFIIIVFQDTSEDDPTPSEASDPGTSDEAVRVVPPDPLVHVEEVRRLSRRKSDLFPRISAQAAARRQANASRPITPECSGIVEKITLSKCGWDCSKGRGTDFNCKLLLFAY